MRELTLGEALVEYKEIYMASRNFAQRTRVEYLNDLEDLIKFLEHLGVGRVGDIGLPQLERYLAELDRRGLAGITRKRKVVSIRSLLWYLYQDGYISTNLAKRIIPPFAEAKSPRYLTKSECDRLLEAAAQNQRDYALIQLLLQTGIKLSELTRLTVADVEFPSVVKLESKDFGYVYILGNRSKKERTIPLNHEACIALANYFKRKNATIGFPLFVNRFGKGLSARGVEKIVKKYMFQVGIADASVQSLRNTFGVRKIVSGTSLETVRELMGNGDGRSMSMYLAVSEQVSGWSV